MAHDRAKYLKVWFWLTVLTAVEVFVATAPWPRPAVYSALGGMAAAKALLVAMYFMHLRYESRWLGLAALFPVILSITALVLVVTDAPILGIAAIH